MTSTSEQTLNQHTPTVREKEERELANACYIVGCNHYKRGNIDKAIENFERAKKYGSPDASYMIGCYYEQNIYDDKFPNRDYNKYTDDLITMKNYFKFAAELGHEGSQKKLKEIM